MQRDLNRLSGTVHDLAGRGIHSACFACDPRRRSPKASFATNDGAAEGPAPQRPLTAAPMTLALRLWPIRGRGDTAAPTFPLGSTHSLVEFRRLRLRMSFLATGATALLVDRPIKEPGALTSAFEGGIEARGPVRSAKVSWTTEPIAGSALCLRSQR